MCVCERVGGTVLYRNLFCSAQAYYIIIPPAQSTTHERRLGTRLLLWIFVSCNSDMYAKCSRTPFNHESSFPSVLGGRGFGSSRLGGIWGTEGMIRPGDLSI